MILIFKHCSQLKIKWHMVIVRVCGKCMATLHYTELSHNGWLRFMRIRMPLGIISIMTNPQGFALEVTAGSEHVLDDMPVDCGGRDE
jgi:hypothetical protein